MIFYRRALSFAQRSRSIAMVLASPPLSHRRARATIHHGMHLIAFDLDGTLLDTYETDGACFLAALRDECGIDGASDDWASFEHTTDAGIFDEIVRRHRGASPSTAELRRFRAAFVRELEAAHRRAPFSVIRGADALLRALDERASTAVAIATGGWASSAQCKLRCCGLSLEHVPIATSDDAVDRESIVRCAIRRSEKRASVQSFESVTYVGDGAWDARTCRNLGIPLIGVGQGERAQRLRSEHVTHVLPDFSEPARFFDAWEALRQR